MLFALTVFLIRIRAKLFARLHWLIWWATFNLAAKHRLQATRKLIDARFKTAGIPRPKSVPVANWFRQVDESAGQYFFGFWHAANFSSNPIDLASQSVAAACKELASDLPYTKIEQFRDCSKTKSTKAKND